VFIVSLSLGFHFRTTISTDADLSNPLFGQFAQVMNAITISRQSDQVLELEWTSSASHDMIADSALGVLSGMDNNFATIKSEWGYVPRGYQTSIGVEADRTESFGA